MYPTKLIEVQVQVCNCDSDSVCVSACVLLLVGESVVLYSAYSLFVLLTVQCCIVFVVCCSVLLCIVVCCCVLSCVVVCWFVML